MLDVRGGDLGKLELLFDRHHRALFRYFLHLTSNRAVSEDLVQEVFLRILKYRHTYQPETRFCAWMFQVGRNVHMDHAVQACRPIFRRRAGRRPRSCAAPWRPCPPKREK